MAKVYSPLKWTGIKRKQAPYIIQLFPEKIDTYIEPFLGGGGVLMYLLNECQDRITPGAKIYCTDTNSELIKIWKTIKSNPDGLINEYTKLWTAYNTTSDGVLHTEDIVCSIKDRDTNEVCQHRKNFYYKMRDQYSRNFVDNGISDPYTFYWIMKTCFNGLIRYNKKGYLNAPSQMTRSCMSPEKIEKLVKDASYLLNLYNVEFECHSYETVSVEYLKFRSEGNNGVVVYCDPPYISAGVKYTKDNDFDFNKFKEWINNLDCNVYCSFDGNGCADWIFEDNNWIKSHISNGKSGFKLMNSINTKDDKKEDTYECLYVKSVQ